MSNKLISREYLNSKEDSKFKQSFIKYFKNYSKICLSQQQTVQIAQIIFNKIFTKELHLNGVLELNICKVNQINELKAICNSLKEKNDIRKIELFKKESKDYTRLSNMSKRLVSNKKEINNQFLDLENDTKCFEELIK